MSDPAGSMELQVKNCGCFLENPEGVPSSSSLLFPLQCIFGSNPSPPQDDSQAVTAVGGRGRFLWKLSFSSREESLLGDTARAPWMGWECEPGEVSQLRAHPELLGRVTGLQSRLHPKGFFSGISSPGCQVSLLAALEPSREFWSIQRQQKLP